MDEEFADFKKESETQWIRINNKCEFLAEQIAKNAEQQAKTSQDIQTLTQVMATFAVQAEADRQIMRNMLAKMGTHDELIKDHEKRIKDLE